MLEVTKLKHFGMMQLFKQLTLSWIPTRRKNIACAYYLCVFVYVFVFAYYLCATNKCCKTEALVVFMGFEFSGVQFMTMPCNIFHVLLSTPPHQ